MPADRPAKKMGDHWLMYSPNTDRNLSFDEAYNRLGSSNHAAFKNIANEIMSTAGIQPGQYEQHDAIGDSSANTGGSSENSLIHVIHNPPDEDTTKYLGSWLGMMGQQANVLHFHQDEGGPDSLYQVFVPEGSANKVREQLDRFGIPFRSIVPRKQGNLVVLYDEKRSLRPNVQAFGDNYDATIREATGRGEFIGSDTWDNARPEYRKRINAYEAGKVRARTQRPQDLPHPNAVAQTQATGPRVQNAAVRPATLPRPSLSTTDDTDTLGGGGAAPGGPARAPVGGEIVRGMNFQGGEILPKMQPSPFPVAPVAGQPPLPTPPSSTPSVSNVPPGVKQQVLTPPRTPEHEQTFREVSAHLGDHLAQHVVQGKISEDQAKSYSKAAHGVWSTMSHESMQRFQANVKEWLFFPNTEALTQHVLLFPPPGVDSVGGAYSYKTGRLKLDGPHKSENARKGTIYALSFKPDIYDRSDDVQAHIYAHEFMHAIDGIGLKLSSSDAWRQVAHAELSGGQLTKYCMQDQHEAFAEFGRILHIMRDQSSLAKFFPKCYKFFARNKLCPIT